MSNIIFIIHYPYQSEIIVRISDRLATLNYEVYILGFGNNFKKYYNYSQCINLCERDCNDEGATEFLNAFLTKNTLFKIMDADRFLDPYNEKEVIYLARVFHNYRKIVQDKKPICLISEFSTSVEYTFSLYNESIKIHHLTILNFPFGEKLGCFYNREHRLLVCKKNPILEKIKSNSRYEDLGKELKKQRNKTYFSALGSIDNYDRDDYRTWLSKKFKNQLKIFLYKKLSIISKRKLCYELPSVPFVYFALHVQPEETPDFVSLEFRDQFKLLRYLRKILPEEIKIVVKDHPWKISARDWNDEYRLMQRDGIIFLQRDFNSLDIIQKSCGTISIAGSVLVESILIGRPSLCFSNSFHLEHFTFIFDGKNINSIIEFLNCTKSSNYISRQSQNELEKLCKILPSFLYVNDLFDKEKKCQSTKNIFNITEYLHQYLYENNYLQ